MNITLIGIEPKKSKTGTPFWKVKDDKGNEYTIWDQDIADMITIGSPASYIIKETGAGFKNIRGIESNNTQVQRTAEPTDFIEVKDGKYMPLSAKDVTIIAQTLTKIKGSEKREDILEDFWYFLEHVSNGREYK